MNMFIITGNLAADPEIKTYNEASFTVFCVAVQDGYGDKKKTYFMDCIASGVTGENIAKYFEKGKGIIVQGKLYIRKSDEGHNELKLSAYKFEFPPSAGDGKGKGGKGGGQGKKKDPPKQDTSVDDIPF
jgi:single-strand DNA-binding protein